MTKIHPRPAIVHAMLQMNLTLETLEMISIPAVDLTIGVSRAIPVTVHVRVNLVETLMAVTEGQNAAVAVAAARTEQVLQRPVTATAVATTIRVSRVIVVLRMIAVKMTMVV